jgi:hypothetical protein
MNGKNLWTPIGQKPWMNRNRLFKKSEGIN